MATTAEHQEAERGGHGEDGAPRAQLVRAAPRRPSSLREMVGSEEAMMILLDCLGPVGKRYDGRSLAQVLAHGRVVPGVCVASAIKVGPAGAMLLMADTTLGGLVMEEGSSWVHVFDALKQRHGELRMLGLCMCGLEPGDATLLADTVSKLQVFEVSNNRFQARGGSGSSSWLPLLSALKDNVRLCTLCLGGCWLTAGDGQTLAKSLEQGPSGVLQVLEIKWNRGLGDGGCSAIIAACLKPDSALRKLKLDDTGMGRATGLVLASCLRSNNTLQVLDISSNNLGGNADFDEEEMWEEEGDGGSWPEVFAACGHNTGLQALSLQLYGLEPPALDALGAALSANRVLQNLYISGDRLGDDGPAVLAAGLSTNTALRAVRLEFRDLEDHGLLPFARVFRTNTTLREFYLDLGDNHVVSDSRIELLEEVAAVTGCSVHCG